MLRTSCTVVLAASLLGAPLACGGVTSTFSARDAGADGGTQGGSGISGTDSGGGSSNDGSAESGGGTGSTSGGGSSGSSGGDGACTTDAQCGSGAICGFRVADGCTATGICFPAPGIICDAYSPACACDGSEVNAICNGLPSGYATRPVLHSGACPLLEAGASCASDTECQHGLKCCYPCRAPGCSDECVTATASGACPPMPP